MLTNYILSCKKASGKLPEKPVVVKTIVTTKLINKLCEKYGCELKNVLTGFKYIGEVILNLEKKHEENRYLFGFENSYQCYYWGLLTKSGRNRKSQKSTFC